MAYRPKIIILLLFTILFFQSTASSAAATADRADRLLKSADECRKKLVSSVEKKKYRHNWEACVRKYEAVYRAFPESDEAAWALYQEGRLYSDLYYLSGRSGDLERAVDFFKRLTGKFESHRLADDAYYHLGEIYYKYRKDNIKAREAFSNVVERYPKGDMTSAAGKMLLVLEKKGGKKITLSAGPPLQKGSKEASRLLNDADKCRKSLLTSSKKKKYRHNWKNCIKKYIRVLESHPGTDQAVWATYRAGLLFQNLYRYSGRSKDLDEALAYYRIVAEKFASHQLADDAQYRTGEIYLKEKNDPTQAYVEFLKVDIKFPSGDMRAKAKKRLDQLAVALSKRDDVNEVKNRKKDGPGVIKVHNIRHWSTPNYTRVVLDVEAPVKYEHHLLKADPDNKKPRRLYIDLKSAVVSSKIESAIPIKDGLLQRARAAQYDKDVVRVVLDTQRVGGYKVFHLHDPFRIVVDVRRFEKTEQKERTPVKTRKRRVGKGVKRADNSHDSVSLARQLGLNVKKIVIDPGHGGKDPGCILGGKIREKDLVLKIAKLLAKEIKTKIGCEVCLTRDKDIFLPLERRTAIANMQKADLFISLHINAHRNKKIYGLETYFLNMATDERAVMVAARENATSEKNISDLQSILNDLMLNTKIHESSRLAKEVQNGVVYSVKKGYKPVRNLGVKQAPFYVLIGAEMPAVLVEAGFLTNSTERKRLLSSTYHKRLAEGICSGVKSYMENIDQIYGGG